MRRKLQRWRNAFNVADAIKFCRCVATYSVVILCAGGLLDTFGAVRAGFLPVWGTEICEKQRKMWDIVTGAPMYPDTFKDIPYNARTPIYMKSGQPCPDYTFRGPVSRGLPHGEDGPTGWMFVKQADVILKQRPKAFCLEMTDNAVNIHCGKEIDKVILGLSKEYIVYYNVIQMWKNGDPSSRRRLFIVGMHKSLGKHAKEFSFPKPAYNHSNAPRAIHIAVPDNEVPNEYWVRRNFTPYLQRNPNPRPGTLQTVAQVGAKGDIGHSSSPHTVYSWYGLMNAQLTTNGGGVRPPLNWWYNGPLEWARLTTPLETIRCASLPDDYMKLMNAMHGTTCECHKHESHDAFIRRCVNNGVPINTSYAIDMMVHKVLRRAGVPTDVMGSKQGPISKVRARYNLNPLYEPPECSHEGYECALQDGESGCKESGFIAASAAIEPKHNKPPLRACLCDVQPCPKLEKVLKSEVEQSWVGLKSKIRCIHVDTMANKTFFKSDVSKLLTNTRQSNARIRVANKQTMRAEVEGSMPCIVLNMSCNSERHPFSQNFTFEGMTVPELHRELLSVDDLYQAGFSVDLKHPNRNDGPPDLYRPATHNSPEVRLPLSYDWSGNGGFRLYYIPSKTLTEEDKRLIKAHSLDTNQNGEEAMRACEAAMLAPQDAARVDRELEAHEGIAEVISSPDNTPSFSTIVSQCVIDNKTNKLTTKQSTLLTQHPEERMLKGTIAGLKRGRAHLSNEEAHKLFGHLGYCPGCKLCAQVKGNMRRIRKKPNPHRESRPGCVWAMDMITWSHGSDEGNKYLVVLRCLATGAFKLIPLYRKDEIGEAFQEWVLDMRNDPLYKDHNYPLVCSYAPTTQVSGP